MARRPNQDNFKNLRTQNMSQIAQTIDGIHIPGKIVAVPLTTKTFIGYGRLCRVITTAITTIYFGDSTIAGAQLEGITLPANTVSYVYAVDDYVYASVACTFEVIVI